MIRFDLARFVDAALTLLQRDGRLPATGLPKIEIADAKDPAHGDFATNFALASSKAVGKNPREIAELLRSALLESTPAGVFAAVEIAGPGFINFRLEPAFVAGYVDQVITLGPAGLAQAGRTDAPQRINVEFVSVNPNGPITVGSGRGAAFGSTLATVLETAGHDVHREYYINDGVNSEQMRVFAESVKAIVDGVPLPEKGYKGDYVADVAAELKVLVEQKEPVDLLDLKTLLVLIQSRVRQTLSAWSHGKALGRVPWDDIDEEIAHRISGRQALGNFAVPYALLDGVVKFATVTDHETDANEFIEHTLGSPAVGRCMTREDFHSLLTMIYEDPLEVGREAPCAKLVDAIFRQALIDGATAIRFGKRSTSIDVFFFKDGAWSSAMNMPREHLAHGVAYWIEACHQLDESGDFMWLPNIQCWLKVKKSGVGLDSEIHFEPTTFPDRLSTQWYQELSQHAMLARQRTDLASFGVTFDTWYSEQALHDDGRVEQEVAALIAKGAADELPIRHKLKLAKGGKIEDVEIESQAGEMDADGDAPNESNPQSPIDNPQTNTLWLRSTKFGDDQDRVLRRKDGRLTYIASDVAYHKDKFNRPANADKLITILGPDHHGYIQRLHAVLAALEMDIKDATGSTEPLNEIDAKIYATPEERDACRLALARAQRELEVVIFQIVRFVKDGQSAPMRKRDGNIYSLRDLITEIGKNSAPNDTVEEQMRIGRDVARFFYLMRSHDTHMDFDIDLATKQNDENPVFYVQYAHARICSVIAKAKEAGLPEVPPAALVHPKELALILKLCDLPYEIQRCAEDYGVHRLTTYAQDLARTYHAFYDACRVILPEDPALSRARLQLCEAAKVGLRAALDVLGVSAPERMDRAPEA